MALTSNNQCLMAEKYMGTLDLVACLLSIFVSDGVLHEELEAERGCDMAFKDSRNTRYDGELKVQDSWVNFCHEQLL